MVFEYHEKKNWNFLCLVLSISKVLPRVLQGYKNFVIVEEPGREGLI
jgi:hypothetical protein